MTSQSSTYSYTYVHQKRHSIFKYPHKITQYPPYDPYFELNNAKKIVYAIKNYPARKSFYFSDWDDLKVVAHQVIWELQEDSTIVGKIGWNDFSIKFRDQVFEINRKLSSDLSWKTFEILKLEQ